MDALEEEDIVLLVQMIIHDLEKPLAVTGRILGRVMAGSMDPKNPRHARLIRSSASAVDRSRRMLEDLRAVLTTRAITPRFVHVRLQALTLRIMDEFTSMARAEDIRFEAICDLDRELWTDPDLVHRVVDNFLYNALRHAEDHILLMAGPKGSNAFSFRVENNGPSIPEDRLDLIFQPGVQLGLRMEKKWRGQGLGLAFCHKAAKALGGRVKAENLPDGRGAAFTLDIPSPAK